MEFFLRILPLLASARSRFAPLAGLSKALSAALFGSFITPAPATAYPVDCAILLCLAGGFPASIECAHARAVMIARITPWPIEPPLQIWNCPMRIEYRRPMNRRVIATPVLQDVSLPLWPGRRPEGWGVPLPVQSAAISGGSETTSAQAPGFWLAVTGTDLPSLTRVQDRADVDISEPSYDFVRSIRVTNIEYSQRRKSDGDCSSATYVRLGLYGAQGDYSWQRGRASDIPAVSSFAPRNFCGEYYFRSVIIEWRDSAGDPDFEEVAY